MKTPSEWKKEIKKYLHSDNLTPNQKEVLKKYDKYNKAQDLSIVSRRTILSALTIFLKEFEKDIGEMNREDIIDYFSSDKFQKYRNSTKQRKKGFIKAFFKWFYSEIKQQHLGIREYPSIVNFKTTRQENKKTLEKEVLNRKDIRKLLNITNNPRDKALIITLYESGCRSSEFLGLNIGDVSIEKDVAKIIVDGKTGERRIPLFDSLPYLKEWLNNHPKKNDPKAPLWISFDPGSYGKRLKRLRGFFKSLCWRGEFKLEYQLHPTKEYSEKEINVMNMLNNGASESKIKTKLNVKNLEKVKRKLRKKPKIYPHLFRHSRATEIAKKGYNEAFMRNYFGWSKNGNMPSHYSHLAQSDTEEIMKEKMGLKPKKEEEKEDKLKPVECWNCGYENPTTNVYCSECNSKLDMEEKVQDKMLRILRDPEIQKRIAEKYSDEFREDLKGD